MSIHLKVKLADTELLTTRLYFADDPLLETDSIFSCVEDNRLLLLDPIRVTTDAGEEVETATQLLVIDTQSTSGTQGEKVIVPCMSG